MNIIQGQIVAGPGEHVVLLGPIEGTVTTAGGATIDVSPVAVACSTVEAAAEVAHLVGLRYAAEGHPDHDEETPFVYEPPEEFAGYEPHADNTTIATPEG